MNPITGGSESFNNGFDSGPGEPRFFAINNPVPGDSSNAGSTSLAQPLTISQATPVITWGSPADITDYSPANASVTLMVNKATPVITWATPAAITFGGGPAGSECADLPTTVRVDGTAFAISGILFPKNSTPGVYTINFIGVSGAITATATAKFTVT